MNTSVGNKILSSVIALGLTATVMMGAANTASAASMPAKKNPNSISSEYSKKNGWTVFHGTRKGAWVAENFALGGHAIPKSRSSKKVSANIVPVDQTSRSTVQDYTINFKGFKTNSPVKVTFVESRKAIPAQVFENVKSGDTVSINVSDNSGKLCGSFYVFVEDTKKNWAVEHIYTLYSPN